MRLRSENSETSPTASPRVPGSNADLRRSAPAANSFRLCGVLQSSAYPLGITKRCALAPSSPTIWCHCRNSDLGWAASQIRTDMIFGKDSTLRAASEAPVTRIAQFDSHFINFSMPVLLCTVGANHAICVLALRTLRHFSVQAGLDCVLERPRP